MIKAVAMPRYGIRMELGEEAGLGVAPMVRCLDSNLDDKKDAKVRDFDAVLSTKRPSSNFANGSVQSGRILRHIANILFQNETVIPSAIESATYQTSGAIMKIFRAQMDGKVLHGLSSAG